MQLTKKYKASLAVAAVVLIGLPVALLVSGHLLQAAEKPVQRLQAIPVEKVGRGDVVQQIELPGEFRPYQEVDVDAKVKGYIKTLNADVGDRVKQGQTLAQLEIPEAADNLAKAVAAIERARQQSMQSQAVSSDAKATYERLAAVMKERPGLVAQEEIDQARAKADAAEAAATADKSAIAEARANQRELGDVLGYAQITAPFDGIVTALYVSVGALMGEGTGHSGSDGHSLVHLSQLDRLRLIIKVPESIVPTIHEGDAVSVVIPALGKTRRLQITRMSHEVDLATRSMHVEIDYPNADLAVTPGTYADVTLAVSSHKSVLSIPLEAVTARKEQSGRVLVLRNDGSVGYRQVTLGLVNATRAEVTSGLKAGEQVVVGAAPENEAGITYVPRAVALN